MATHSQYTMCRANYGCDITNYVINKIQFTDVRNINITNQEFQFE